MANVVTRSRPSLPYVVAITGGSGAPYACRLLDLLLHTGQEVHLTISPTAAEVFRLEMQREISLTNFDPKQITSGPTERLHYHRHDDFSAGIASGSFRTAGMVVVPCSMSTLGSLASGISTNLILRAAEVHLKERRKLILVPRETPLSLIAIENLATVTRAGAVVLPAMPGFYHQPKSIDDLVDFVVCRIADQLGMENELVSRWGQ